ncbi:hypothetical protein BN14_11913 [Rhizoctonia solani AG-1 IB]|uniref:Uncharacterized protein n=1 Tax=Thanatephorus cucumeris (strain AG1-IB / isolate 7/3/14) TaxID=1108050 RepID=M5CCS9_THACB|nr:hypothetical protein BN14_11913 [Rhizoctonia solani AG-1 IB]
MALAPDLCGMTPALEFRDYKILQYTSRHNPAGARLKPTVSLSKSDRTILEGIKRIQEKQAQKRTIRIGQRMLQGNQVVTGDTHTALGQHPADAEDFLFFERLINNDLVAWLWSKFPARDRTEKPDRFSYQAPFKLRHWNKSVAPAVYYTKRTSRTGFNVVINKLFPADWTIKDRGKIWESYQTLILNPIARRLEGGGEGTRGQAARTEEYQGWINRVIESWEYLPCVQDDRIWSYKGSGGKRIYMLYPNPTMKGANW